MNDDSDSREIKKDEPDESNRSFLSILHDKNKVIQILKQQLANQKLQIMYYMKKELDCTKLAELSNTCSPENLDDCLPVVLSLEHFRKNNGLKSNLFRLYEYMENLDKKLNKSLSCQEDILRQIIEKLCLAMKDSNKLNISVKFDHPVEKNMCLDLFNNLLEATVCLRRKLDSFRICCNRLILVEDERNNLVEQVVTLPAKEKFNCSFLINIKHDKNELEKQIKLLTEKNSLQSQEIHDLNVIEQKLSKIQKQLKTSMNESGDFNNVSDMVKSLNFEANYLLKVSETHQAKCQVNTSNNVSNIIKYINTSLEGGEIGGTDFSKEELGIIETIKEQFNLLNDKTKQDNERLTKENDELKKNLNEALIEKNKLKIANIHLQTYIEKLQKNCSSEILLLKQQRDNFEAQVEDLEELRKSYIELIILPNSGNSNKEKQLSQAIRHLEKKLQLMKEIIQKQNKEISIQRDLIENLKSQYDKKRKSDQQNLLASESVKRSLVVADEAINNPSICDEEENDNHVKNVTRNSVQELSLSELFNWSEEKEKNSADSSTVSDNVKLSNYLKIVSKNSDVKEVVKEIFQTIIKDSKLNRKSNVSSYSLQIKCTCQNDCQKQDCACHNESELMRDCSKESLAIFCRPIQKNKENKNMLEAPYPVAESGYSRNIEVLVQNNNRLKSSSSEEYNL